MGCRQYNNICIVQYQPNDGALPQRLILSIPPLLSIL